MLEYLLRIFVSLTRQVEEIVEMVGSYDRLALHTGTSFGNALEFARIAHAEVLKAEKAHDLNALLDALAYYTETVQTVSRVGAGLLEGLAHDAGVVAGSNSAACEAAYSEGVQDGESNARYAAEQYQRALDLMCRCLDPGVSDVDCPVHGCTFEHGC